MSTIEVIQKRLEKHLYTASLADDRELAGKIREKGRRLAFLLNGLIRTSRLYDKDNEAFDAPSQEFANILQSLVDLVGAVHLICVEDQIYMNDIRLRYNPDEQVVMEALIVDLARHGVGGISFHAPLTPSSVKGLAMLLAPPPAVERSQTRHQLSASIAELGDISLMGIHHFQIGGEPSRRQMDYLEAVRKSARVVREAIRNLAAGRIPNPLPVRRSVIDLIASLRENPDAGKGASLRSFGGATVGERHLLSVASLAICIGQALGLPEGVLSDLGVAAMLHDVGYTRVPDRTGHAAAGARLLLRQRGFHEAKIHRLLLVLEHHLPFKDTETSAGDDVLLPETGKAPSFFARILHIADDYDVLVSPRPGYPPPVSPATAMASMWSSRGSLYDPVLLTVFAQIMGQYPPGTIIKLSDGRWAVSVSGGRDKIRFSWPIVRIVRAADGSFCEIREKIDLFEARSEVLPQQVMDPSVSEIENLLHMENFPLD